MNKLCVGVVVAMAGCADQASAPSGPHHLYQATGEQVPTTQDEANAYGTHNALGLMFALVVDQGLGDPQGATDQAFMAHQVPLTIDVQRPDSGATTVGINTFAGVASGFDPTSPAQPPLIGSGNGSQIMAGPGDLAVSIAPFGMALPITLHGAKVQMSVDPAQLHATVTGGLDQTTIDQELIPSWVLVLQPILIRDCPAPATPGCGCVAHSPGGDAIQILDTNHDCRLTADELVQSSFIQGLTQTDETIDGKPAVSFAFSLDATYAQTVP